MWCLCRQSRTGTGLSKYFYIILSLILIHLPPTPHNLATECRSVTYLEKGKSVPLQARGAQRVPEVKVHRLRDNGPEWW